MTTPLAIAARKARMRYQDRAVGAGSSEASQQACWEEAVRPLVEEIEQLRGDAVLRCLEWLFARADEIEAQAPKSSPEVAHGDRVDALVIRGAARDMAKAFGVEKSRPRCPDCQGDLGGEEIGRIESHDPKCPRFPL